MNSLELSAFGADIEKPGGRRAEGLWGHPMVFVERFWKWRDSLFVVAFRILGDVRSATKVVDECFVKAWRTCPRFATEGAFGSWLLRMVIDDALGVRRLERAPRLAGKRSGEEVTKRSPEMVEEFWCVKSTM